jgi:hypothetical protein
MNEPTGYETRQRAITPAEYWNTSYAREMRRRFEYYQGNQFVHTPLESEDALTPADWANAWSGSGWEDIKALLPDIYDKQYIHPVGIRFVSIIIDNRQVVYTVPPEKRLVVRGDGAVEEDASVLLKRIYTAAQHDLLADQLCKWTGLFHTAFQYVGWDPTYKRVVKRNLKPYEVFVVPSIEAPTDLQHPDCFIAIAQPPAALTETTAKVYEIVWQCWWEDEYWYERYPGQEFRDPALTEAGRNKNPFRTAEGVPVKPLLVVHDQQSQDMYFHGPDNLVLQNQRLDRDMTALAHTMEYQGFSVPVARGMDYEEAATQGWSPGSLWVIPSADGDLSFAHPAAPVGEFFGAALKKARMFARLEGVDPEVVDPEVRIASGVSKAQSRRVLAEKREEQFPKWQPYEREAYWLTAIVWNTYARSRKLPVMSRFEDVEDPMSDYNIVIEFGELDPIVDPLADVLEKGHRLNMGLSTLPELIAAERRIPLNIARELAMRNRAENEAMGFTADALTSPAQGRIGQSGNRPREQARKPSSSGDNTTADSGNTPVKQAAIGQIRGGDTD